MKETRYFYVPDAATVNELPAEEASHAVRVLRMQSGDEMMLMDGKGAFYRATVTLASSHHCLYDIVETLPQQPTWRGHLHLAIAPTKLMDRMEWMVEKMTEVGFDEMSLLDCQFSERRVVKLPRLEKIVVSAVKQSRKAWMPVLNELQSFKQFIKNHPDGLRYIAHCYDEVHRVNLFDELRSQQVGQSDQDIIVMIGPEGDFSIEEVRMAVEAGFVSVDLGKIRLRTETAGLSAVMMMQLAQQ
ncbi:MAG: 16S rRNA (uracil(1498)-N(3))-methyltransferase [Prevotella sp.]|nr:16S rRNA (uracil(1498)-N(3))-methyltransferase [Prevotella sp.]